MGSGQRLRLELSVGKGFIIYPLLPLVICSVTNVSSSDECNICEKITVCLMVCPASYGQVMISFTHISKV
jgi:hypothetical protein